MPDPFTQVYDTLLQSLQSNAAILALSQRLKFIHWDSTRDPNYEIANAADFPLLSVRSATVETDFDFCSSHIEVKRNYEMLLNTGDKRLGIQLLPCEFAVMAACYSLHKSGALDALTWKGDKFVSSVLILNMLDGLASAQENSLVQAWVSVITLEITLHLAVVSLAEYSDTGSLT